MCKEPDSKYFMLCRIQGVLSQLLNAIVNENENENEESGCVAINT